MMPVAAPMHVLVVWCAWCTCREDNAGIVWTAPLTSRRRPPPMETTANARQPPALRKARTTLLAESIGRLYFQFLEAQMAEELARAENGSEQDEQSCEKHRGAHLLRLSAAWRQRKTPARIRAILDEEGVPQTRPEDQARILAGHWQAVFSVIVEDEAARRLARGRVPQLPQAQRQMQCKDFDDMVIRSKTTPPGPDGISYTAWRKAPELTRAGKRPRGPRGPPASIARAAHWPVTPARSGASPTYPDESNRGRPQRAASPPLSIACPSQLFGTISPSSPSATEMQASPSKPLLPGVRRNCVPSPR